ncbi:MAE_28990/MAE_18760 family HEPN-like nuclease [Lysinibacillus fusiformis]|uniref:MAE_28990/MAE_18760 family HEPN-like nuclease n=1 Tax=Lysinibacillus fusiformis TaxID=28031 RepID=UPI0008926A39|nr:MAE_28990/MAE_18760 family HEPN-like nuclease [Lysinibacillus fusiformis]SCX66926.1 hypothetical protein SAMN02787108_03892 [Lysinibacillus fusiformis]SDB41153.1 hypothetical protein SAMN02787070_02967 [Lysinibacillus fusiformis]SFI55285.1 hypothetical protein SAMN02787080_02982 [Lysinibacillus fusiformis]SFT23982.1 hypothetical protein SAMN02787099_03772 [Lysinibacillus fusiformis]
MDSSVNLPVHSEEDHTIQSDIELILLALNSAETKIRSEMNFLKYYQSVLENDDKIELNCLRNNGGLFKLILSVYATYEFAVKRMLLDTLEFIDKKRISIHNLQVKIRALYFKEGIDDIRKKITNNQQNSKEHISSKLVKIFNHLTEADNFEVRENMIDTNSNLKFDTFCEILSYFDFDKGKYTKYEKYIKSLVHYRNNVAHGNIGFIDRLPQNIMPINDGNYEIVCENIIDVLKDLFQDIQDYLIEEKYKI